MNLKLWQAETIVEVQRSFATDQAVKALILVGSNASESADLWSDVDFICIVDDSAIDQFYPVTEWLGALGDVFAIEQFTAHPRFVTRVCLTDFRRIDFVFIAESALTAFQQWFYSRSQTQILFSRSVIVDKLLMSYPDLAEIKPAFDYRQFEKMSNEFWFKAVIAVTKVMRNDLLIGLHLALDLSRDCLVLGMIFRDRDAGTTIHRFGGFYNEIVDDVGLQSSANSKADGILEIILQSANVYDHLASRWSTTYRSHYEPFREWVESVKEHRL